jgi:hypothetical protein
MPFHNCLRCESIKGDKHLQEWSTINVPTIKAHNDKIAGIARSRMAG